jgi:hypothetical protein
MYENRMMSYEVRTTDDVLRDMQRQFVAQQKRNKPATVRPAITVRPTPRPTQSWAVVSAQLELKRKRLQLLAA